MKLKYIELKSGFGDRGPAWVAFVKESKNGTTFYFNGRALKKQKRGGSSGNYYDLENGDLYWISNPKKLGGDRHWAGGGKVHVQAAALDQYLKFRSLTTLDPTLYEITDMPLESEIGRFHDLENQKLRIDGEE